MNHTVRALRVALGFLTTLPVPLVSDWRDDDLRLAVAAYPLVGLILGVILTLAFALLTPFAPPLRATLLTALWLLLTGALHFDGFCDLADAAFAPKAAEERWRIVKDPRLGAFALAAGVMLLLVKVASLASLTRTPALLLAPLLSRTWVVYAMARYPVYDASLLGRRSSLPWRETLLPLTLGVGLSALWGLILGPLATLTLLTTGLLSTLLLAPWLNTRMQGLGGDAYGALVETSEAAMLVAATLF